MAQIQRKQIRNRKQGTGVTARLQLLLTEWILKMSYDVLEDILTLFFFSRCSKLLQRKTSHLFRDVDALDKDLLLEAVDTDVFGARPKTYKLLKFHSTTDSLLDVQH